MSHIGFEFDVEFGADGTMTATLDKVDPMVYRGGRYRCKWIYKEVEMPSELKCTQERWARVREALESNVKSWTTAVAGPMYWTGARCGDSLTIGRNAFSDALEAKLGVTGISWDGVKARTGVDIPAILRESEESLEERAVRGARAMVISDPVTQALDCLTTCAAHGMDQWRAKWLAAAIIRLHDISPAALTLCGGGLWGWRGDARQLGRLALSEEDDARVAISILRRWHSDNGHGSLLEALAEHAP